MSEALQSALVVEVPEAEPVVGALRQRLDSGARLGVPAHVTVVYPFVPAARVDDAVEETLTALFDRFPPFDVTFSQSRWFGEDVIWLAPDDDRPFRALTDAVVAAFPAFPPYEGRFADVVPHLTIGDSASRTELLAAGQRVTPGLPVHSTVMHVSLFAGSTVAGSWGRTRTFQLG